MTHSNNFVLAIKDQNGRVLRESDGKVYLPFHSEYSLRLKNLGHVRAACAVTIDGTDVLGGRDLIIDPHDTTDLERFVIDGRLDSGNRFKFVPVNDNRVQDPSSRDNGFVEVKFWEECVPYCPPSSNFITKSWPPQSDPFVKYYCDAGSPTFTSDTPLRAMNMSSCCFSAQVPDMAGATVEGSHSSQQFHSIGGFNKSAMCTILRLRLVAANESRTVEDTRVKYCGFCGVRNAYNNKYCGNCGAKI